MILVASPAAGDARVVPLTRGLYALVDADDYDRVAAHRWHASRGPASPPGVFYGRRNVRIAGRKCQVLLHRFILDCGAWDGVTLVDHRNGNSLDNRRSNLRIATPSGNAQNRRNLRSDRYKGVHWNAQCRKWEAQIKIDKRNTYLGLFGSPEEAARAYDGAAARHFGEFAALNFSPVEGSK